MRKIMKIHRVGRIGSILLVLCMILAFLPIATSVTASNTASIAVTFRPGSENNGWIEMKNGTDWEPYNGPGSQQAEAVRICPNTDFSVDWTGIFLRVNGADILTEDIRNQLTGENGYTLTAGTQYALENVEFRQGGGSPGPGPEPGGDPVHGGYEGEQKTVSVTVAGKADFYINDSRMFNGNDGDSFDNVSYHYDGNGYVDFYFNCFVGERITALKINTVDYYRELPTPDTEDGKAALLDACKGQLNEFRITVPYSESGYTIESNVKWLDDDDKDYMVVGNFLWTYTEENQGDDYIDHGRMELIGVNYKGRDYSPEELNNPGTAFDWGQDENGGGAVLPAGAVVTVKLIPDYGYQLTGFGINGGSFGTGDEQSVFTFEIKPGNAHLGAHFTSVKDKVTSSTVSVTSGNITLGSGLSGGSAQLEISDAEKELSNRKLEAFETAAGNYTITNYLNLDLYNVYYKGSTNADDVWKNEVNTLDNDATVSVSLADFPLGGAVNPSDIVIIHNIHNGEDFETIPVDSYDSETNTITFQTHSFSTYAIATTVSVHVDTVNNAVDASSISVELFVALRNGETEEEDSPVRITTLAPENVTVGTFETVKANAVEEAKTKLNAWLETTRRSNPHVKFTVIGDMVVAGDKASFDNRTYTMHNGGSGGTTSRYMEINGDYGQTGSYTVTMTVETEKISNTVAYEFLEGTNEKWTQNSDATITFRANGDFSKFTGVKIDGTLIDAKHYTAVSGSTIITLKADYLKTLSASTHKLTVVYTDGECSADFEVKKAELTPETGDNSNSALWLALLCAACAGVIGTMVCGKRKEYSAK